VGIEEWVKRACRIANRNLTAQDGIHVCADPYEKLALASNPKTCRTPFQIGIDEIGKAGRQPKLYGSNNLMAPRE